MKISILSAVGGIIVTTLLQSPISVVSGLFLMGVGVAPFFPCMIYLTPINFGADVSQSVTGLEMASAYCGTLLAPLMIGIFNGTLTMNCYSVFLICFCTALIVDSSSLFEGGKTYESKIIS